MDVESIMEKYIVPEIAQTRENKTGTNALCMHGYPVLHDRLIFGFAI